MDIFLRIPIFSNLRFRECKHVYEKCKVSFHAYVQRTQQYENIHSVNCTLGKTILELSLELSIYRPLEKIFIGITGYWGKN